MISSLMQAIVDHAPIKARGLQRSGKLEQYAKTLAQTAANEISSQNVPATDPARLKMVEETAFQTAMAEAISETVPATT